MSATDGAMRGAAVNGSTLGNGTLLAPTEPSLTPEQVQGSIILFYIVLVTLLASQAGLFYWRRQHRKSYDLVTLVGLWVVPTALCVVMHFWRFVVVHIAYSAFFGYLVYRLISTPIGSDAARGLPRRVFRAFAATFRVSVVTGVVGYALLVPVVLTAGPEGPSWTIASLAMTLLWYGLFYGILTRDLAEAVSGRVALRLGSVRRLGASSKDCGICGESLGSTAAGHAPGRSAPAGLMAAGERAAPTAAPASTGAHPPVGGGGISAGAVTSPGSLLGQLVPGSETATLGCGHSFHSDCIRGWTLVGKRDTCPTCRERVDLKRLFAQRPWETTNLHWVQMLDTVRFAVVWNPVILIVLHFILHESGLDGLLEQPAGGGASPAMLGNSTLLGAGSGIGNASALGSLANGTIQIP